MMDPMKHALAKRRGKGIDLTISISPSKDDDKTTDLAPKGDKPPESDEGAGLVPTPSDGHDDMDAQMLGGMSEHDLHDMKDRKPRSLGERAKQGAMQRMHK